MYLAEGDLGPGSATEGQNGAKKVPAWPWYLLSASPSQTDILALTFTTCMSSPHYPLNACDLELGEAF